MNIECCVCDMDGTLLNSKRDISEGNSKALRELKAKGVEIILATGRTDLYVKDVVDRLEISAPVISSNGGMIRQLSTGQVLYHKYIHQGTAGRLTEACFEKNYDCIIYSPDLVYHRTNSERIELFRKYNQRINPSLQVPLQEISQPSELPLGKILKFFIWNINRKQWEELQQRYNQEGHLTMISSEKNGFDVMAQGISKGAGLAFLAKHMGFSLEKTMVFGDNYNDISMLKLAGYPVAMGNGETEVKQVAKYVTRSNDEDGIAYALENYLPTIGK